MEIRTLLVDDQPMVLDALNAMFESRGFQVATASSGQEAIGALRDSVFDLVVTDMRMETSTAGFDVIREAKAQTYEPVVVVLSAFPLRPSEWRAAGADAMFMKAESTRTMVNELERLVVERRTKPRKSSGSKKPASRNAERE